MREQKADKPLAGLVTAGEWVTGDDPGWWLYGKDRSRGALAFVGPETGWTTNVAIKAPAGPETGDAGKRAAIAALRSLGASVPESAVDGNPGRCPQCVALDPTGRIFRGHPIGPWKTLGDIGEERRAGDGRCARLWPAGGGNAWDDMLNRHSFPSREAVDRWLWENSEPVPCDHPGGPVLPDGRKQCSNCGAVHNGECWGFIDQTLEPEHMPYMRGRLVKLYTPQGGDQMATLEADGAARYLADRWPAHAFDPYAEDSVVPECTREELNTLPTLEELER